MEKLIKEIENEELKLNKILKETKETAELIAIREIEYTDLKPDMRRIEELRREAEDKIKFIEGMNFALRILRHSKKWL